MRPRDIPLPYIEQITSNFSNERKVGHGGYGEVYKGVMINGKVVAVKKLYDLQALDSKQFRNEFGILAGAQHQNIVRLLGYCDEGRYKPFDLDGELVFCKMIYRILCFEYLHYGSLDQYLFDESSGLDWCTRYNIIKGICEGLNYLHGEFDTPIFHLDLKPANILLDKNMVPKIADFGLSRIFGGTHTHTTKDCKGTVEYMPPEYLLNRQISNKYDIFSLGVIIIQIMSGSLGFSKFAEMTPEQFTELVHTNWKQRMEAKSQRKEEYCQQVRRCIEIAVSCVKYDRHERPTISDIIRDLKQTEIKDTSSELQARVAKIGPWGGAGGSDHCDIMVAPCQLESMIIVSGEVIYSLEFSYNDNKGQQHTAGPWGGYGPNDKERKRNKIQLGLSEYVMEVSGTIGPYERAPAGVITSLTFVTNAGRYGPFGEAKGIPFQIPAQSNGGIVGFFARAGWYLDAFGVYVNPKQGTKEDVKNEPTLAKIGPWGGTAGNPCDVKVATPHRLRSVTIHSGIVINSLQFSYSDHDGHEHTVGPWGGLGGTARLIQFKPLEFLTEVHGTTGVTNSDDESAADDAVMSLTLVTNEHTYGPFGQSRGTPFHIPIRGGGSIVGFFGRANDSFLHAIGVYANPEKEAMEREAGLTKSALWGRREGGKAHYIDKELAPKIDRLESVTIRSGAVVDSLEFSYSDREGNQHNVGPWGGPGGEAYTIRMGPLESLQGISGTFGPFAGSPDNVVITSLTFATNQCLGYGPYGQGGGTPFNIPMDSEDCIVGFFGRGGSYLEAIGVYTRPDELCA